MVRHLAGYLYSHKAHVCNQTECALYLEIIVNQHISLVTLTVKIVRECALPAIT